MRAEFDPSTNPEADRDLSVDPEVIEDLDVTSGDAGDIKGGMFAPCSEKDSGCARPTD
jgi:hypothetical protein